MEFRTLHGIADTELLRVFNESFANYFVPVAMTLEQLQQKIQSDPVDLDLSVGAFDGDRLVGLILHAFARIDGKNIAYNGATGVVPAYRNQGITRRMYEFILPALRARNISSVELEVITKNLPAIKIYEQAGFVAERKLPCYKGNISALDTSAAVIRELPDYDRPLLRSFWDFSPTWQNSMLVLDALKHSNKLFGAFLNEQTVGYLVYNPLSKRVQQFAVDPAFRRQYIGSALFAHVRTLQQEPLVIINVDGSSGAANAFLKKMGMEVYVEQVGMRLEVGK
jgi:ribosomal protein S18 acetylase RimI-like enzyme